MKKLIFLILSILWAFTSNAQRMTTYSDSNFWFNVYLSSSTDTINHFQLTIRRSNTFGPWSSDSVALFRTNYLDTASKYYNRTTFLGTINWKNNLKLVSNIPNGFSGFDINIKSFDNQLNMLIDSIKIGPFSYFNNAFYFGRTKIQNNRFLYSTSQAFGIYSPMIVTYNLIDSSFKQKYFDSISQDRTSIAYTADEYLQHPSLFSKDHEYYLIVDSLKREIYFNKYYDASTLIQLDSNLNVLRHVDLKYPFLNSTFNTGIKQVKDLFYLGNKYLAVGMINNAIPNNSLSLNRRNEIGVLMLDSSFNVVDTFRITKNSNLSLTTGYMNTACWCEGSLYISATLQTQPVFPSNSLDDYQYPQGLLLARIDTPFNLVWSKQIFIPGRQFRLYDVHCMNGKMIIGGLCADSVWQTTGGVFSIEVDPDGNYLPLNTSEVTEQAVMNPYPNPFEEQLRLPNLPEPLRSFALYDLNGKLHRRFEYPETELSIPGLPSGLYLWQAESISGNLWRGKVVRK